MRALNLISKIDRYHTLLPSWVGREVREDKMRCAIYSAETVDILFHDAEESYVVERGVD